MVQEHYIKNNCSLEFYKGMTVPQSPQISTLFWSTEPAVISKWSAAFPYTSVKATLLPPYFHMFLCHNECPSSLSETSTAHIASHFLHHSTSASFSSTTHQIYILVQQYDYRYKINTTHRPNFFTIQQLHTIPRMYSVIQTEMSK